MRETSEHRYEHRVGAVIRRRYQRAVKGGVNAGYWDTASQSWSDLDGPKPPCAECWAGVSHTGLGWAQHQAALGDAARDLHDAMTSGGAR